MNAVGHVDSNLLLSSVTVNPRSYINGNCSCATSSQCFQSVFFGNQGINDLTYYIDAIYSGCCSMESFLNSLCRCLFSNSCLVDFTYGFVNDLPGFHNEDDSITIPVPMLQTLT